MNPFLGYSEIFFPIIALLLFSLSKKSNKAIKYLILYFIVTAVNNAITTALGKQGINNVIFYHFYSLIEVWILLPVINYFSGNKQLNLLKICLLGYTIIWIINVLFFESFKQFNSNSSGIAALLILFYCFRYILILSKTDDILHFQKIPSFWIVIGFLFYCSTSVLLLSSYKFLPKYLEVGISNVWEIILVLNIIRYLFIIIASICYFRL